MMQPIVKVLCCMGVIFCTLPRFTSADEFKWAQQAREAGPSPASKAAYEKAVAKQKARNEQRQREANGEVSADKVDTAEIEEKLLSRDIEAAKAIVEKYEWNAPLRHESELVIDCVENILWFYKYLNQDHDVSAAIAAYAPMMQSYNNLPDEIPFSDKFVKTINTSIDQAEKFIEKECGQDYGQIRMGMKLSRVQKCVGEYFLRGQTKNRFGIVDEYGRGDTYLFVKDGKVVAWGNY